MNLSRMEVMWTHTTTIGGMNRERAEGSLMELKSWSWLLKEDAG